MSKLIKAIWLFISGFIAVLAIYYLLTGVEQGIDVVIGSGEKFLNALYSILSIFLSAFLIWYSCRLLSYIKQEKENEIYAKKSSDGQKPGTLYRKYAIPTIYHRHIPRMLAYNVFVCIQASIFHLPTTFNWTGWQMLLVMAIHNGFYFLLTKWFESDPGAKDRKKLQNAGLLFIAAYCTFLLIAAIQFKHEVNIFESAERHKFWLMIIALIMFIMQVGSLYLFILRRKEIDAKLEQNISPGKESRSLQRLHFNPKYNAVERPYFHVLNRFTLAALIVYLAAIFIMKISQQMGPLAFTLLALGILTGFSNIISQLSIRWSFNVYIIVYIIALLFGEFRDPYKVLLVESNEPKVFSKRPTTAKYLEDWFKNRQPLIDTSNISKTFPVYLVLSNGGASRAGKWSSGVLSRLQDSSYNVNPKNSFKEHLLCIAGASGGSVGNCAFYSLLKAEHDKQVLPDNFSSHAATFFEGDFLTFTLARLLGPDMFRHLIPIKINIISEDRAGALEDVLSRGSADDLINGYFQKPLTEVFDHSGALPILYINTTQVDNGMPGVISSVKLPVGSQRTDVLSLVDSMSIHKGTEKGNMRLRTAAILSSRFPYVSPAGKVFDRYYVDGGYFDNSGAGTVLEFIQELNSFLDTSRSMSRYRRFFTFHIVHITNSEQLRTASGDIHPLTNDMLAPVLTLAGMQGSSTNIGNGILRNIFRQFNRDTANALITFSLYDEEWKLKDHKGQYEEGYPMSWVISDYQQQRMKVALDTAIRRNFGKFKFK